MARRGIHRQGRLPKPWREAGEILSLYAAPAWSYYQLRGKIGRFKVRVTSRLRHSAQGPPVGGQIVYELNFPAPLPLHLSIRSEDGITRFIRALGFKDIEVGDADFDGRIYVKSMERERVLRFLTEPRREAIVRLAEGHDLVVITSKAIDVLHDEPIERADQIVETVVEMVALAKRLMKEEGEGEAEFRVVEADLEAEAEAKVGARRAEVDAEDLPEDHAEEKVEIDWADAWLLGGEALPSWMLEQGVRLEELEEE